MDIGNLVSDLPDASAGEVVTGLLEREGVRIERIVSHGQASPRGFWYDQDEHEWVMVVRGEASVEFETPPRVFRLSVGDYLYIPAHQRHRVKSTSTGGATVWLAVFFGGPGPQQDSP